MCTASPTYGIVFTCVVYKYPTIVIQWTFYTLNFQWLSIIIHSIIIICQAFCQSFCFAVGISSIRSVGPFLVQHCIMHITSQRHHSDITYCFFHAHIPKQDIFGVLYSIFFINLLLYFSCQLFIITFTHVCMIDIYDVILTCGRSSDLRDCRDGPMRIGQAIRVIPLV